MQEGENLKPGHGCSILAIAPNTLAVLRFDSSPGFPLRVGLPADVAKPLGPMNIRIELLSTR
jgi:hypothetical protein